LLEDYGDRLDKEGRDYINRIRSSIRRMGQLIDALLQLSRVSRTQLDRQLVDLSALVRTIAAELSRLQPGHSVNLEVQGGAIVNADPKLLRIALENLLHNAWKFTGRQPHPHITFGVTKQHGETVYFIRDNGAGFDMAYADKLFTAFQRLHPESQYEGAGIGLATVQRIIQRHGGHIWAEGAVDQGATFYFTLETPR
jgi:light-regulated signal transduction histidine kinase (bacteriophytochrome)